MIDSNNKYTKMQRDYYNSAADLMVKENHKGHNSNPDYYGILLSEVKNNPEFFRNKNALDFGCGCGRNVGNMIDIALFLNVDGCDISSENIEKSKEYLKLIETNYGQHNLFTTDGVSVRPALDNTYDFVMSTIVLQHICVHDIRLSILKDIYRVMKKGGLFSFQMARYNRKIHKNIVSYFDNNYDATQTNGKMDVSVDQAYDLTNELQEIGFKNLSLFIKPEWDWKHEKYYNNGNEWLFVKCYK